MPIIAGIDGCKSGWICITRNLTTGSVDSAVYPNAQTLLQQTPKPEIIAVDIPIGLVESGKRKCDEEARKILKARQFSVFNAPIRSVLRASSQKEACSIRMKIDGKGVSAQSFNIFKKVLEFDEILLKTLQLKDTIKEVHPEICFWAMNNKYPMIHSKKTKEGKNERIKLLTQHFGNNPIRDARSKYRKKDVADDDIHDAFAALWTAERILKGEAGRIPENPPCDVNGLYMGMWY